ncbi:MAG TPA: STAS domain-containing protein [Solirubrobacteraceae bacterium]|nr:STAS domain-containing protein [Solirubrobacteraceae bacterium]
MEFDNRLSLLRCWGDEDRATQGTRRQALARAIKSRRDVVADLSDLAFADSSLMLDLAALARRLRRNERELRLRGAQPQIKLLIELVGLHRLPGVQLEGPSPALA